MRGPEAVGSASLTRVPKPPPMGQSPVGLRDPRVETGCVVWGLPYRPGHGLGLTPRHVVLFSICISFQPLKIKEFYLAI